MTQLKWDQTGERLFETGVDHGVLYRKNGSGDYDRGYAWNGLTAVTESPTGAEATPQYADNIIYLNLVSVERFGCTIEAFTYPDEFAACDGSAEPYPGVAIGQQPREEFGFCWRTRLGNDLLKDAYGYKLHLVWGALAAPSEKAYNTVNESPEAMALSWEVTTTPVAVGTIEGITYKPTASMTITSTKVDEVALAALEDILYGTVGYDASLPSPADVIALFSGSATLATPTMPTFDTEDNEITIPVVTGVVYKIDGEVVTGVVAITANTVVVAVPATGYYFPAVVDNDWLFTYTP